MNKPKYLENIPKTFGIYKMMDKDNKILYIGKAKNLEKRVLSYFKNDKLPVRLQRMVAKICDIQTIITKTEVDALILKCNLIKEYKPPFNILLKDDKSYPFILMTSHAFPRIVKHKGAQKEKGQYFGPYISSSAVDENISQIQKIFKLRTCTDYDFKTRSKPCLNFHIGKCSAPCMNEISEVDYQANVKQALSFLKGKNKSVQRYLKTKMNEASHNLDFEKALMFKNQLQLIEKLKKQTDSYVKGIDEADVIGYAIAHQKISINVFMFRQSKNLGNLSFILDFYEDQPIDDFLKNFLMQFFSKRAVPKFIFMTGKIEDQELIEDILKTKIQPQKKNLIEMATKNAKKDLDLFLNKE